MKSKILGAIDIGSNAIRLLVNNVDDENGYCEFKKAAFLRVPIRLGEDTFSDGYISDEKLYRLNEAMSGFSHMMKAYGVSKYIAYATSAMREAKNGEEVVDFIKKNAGINIQIITGKEEAEIIFAAGGLNYVPDKNETYLSVDVGGGSTELILYSNKEKIDSGSFRIGTVRMLQKKVKKEDVKDLKEWLKNAYTQYGPMNIIASGGNINKVHKLLSKKDREPLPYSQMKDFYNTLNDLSYDERMLKFKLNTYRADVIIPALKIFMTVGKIAKTKDIFVPKVGLVDGIIHSLYTAESQNRE